MYLLGQIVSKGLMQMGRLVKIFIQLPDKPGALKSVVDKIAEISVNIVQVEHDRLSSNVAAGSAGVYLSLELENEKHSRKLLDFLKKEKMVFKVVIVTIAVFLNPALSAVEPPIFTRINSFLALA